MVYHATPLVQTPFLENPNQVYLKLENTQPSGSFKSRGVSTLIEQKRNENPAAHFYSSSGGNAGLAVAEAAFSVGAPATIVVPIGTPDKVLVKMSKRGANVVTFGSMWAEADSHVRELIANDPAGVYCHPFDDPVLWEGHSTLVDELKDQLKGKKPAAITLSVGGGGLYLGVMTGLIRNGWTDVPVYAVETTGANCFSQSLEAGKQVFTSPPTSVAKCLGSTYVPERAVEYGQKYQTHSIQVSDEQSLDSIRKFAEFHNYIVEPACGAMLAAIYDNLIPVEGPIVAIVCGGSSYGARDIAAI